MTDPDNDDGWLRTPLPPAARDTPAPGRWFDRTGEPAPERRKPSDSRLPQLDFPRMVLWTVGLVTLSLAALLLWL